MQVGNKHYSRQKREECKGRGGERGLARAKGCRKGAPHPFPFCPSANGWRRRARRSLLEDRPPLPRSLRVAANEDTSDEEWETAEEQCKEADQADRVFLPASKGRKGQKKLNPRYGFCAHTDHGRVLTYLLTCLSRRVAQGAASLAAGPAAPRQEGLIPRARPGSCRPQHHGGTPQTS